MTQPWRDVMSANAWCECWARASNQTRSQQLDQPITPFQCYVKKHFDLTGTKIATYHSIPKDKLELFPNREQSLDSLKRFVIDWTTQGPHGKVIGRRHQAVQKDGTWSLEDDQYSFLRQPVQLLLERCQLKKMYLKNVREYYEREGQVLRDPKNLIDFIAAPHQQLGCLLPPVPGGRMEVHAPQGISLQFETFAPGLNAVGALPNAFAQWADAFDPQNHNSIRPGNQWKPKGKAPFWVWLEKHPICTGEGRIVTGRDTSVEADALGSVQKIITEEKRLECTLRVVRGFLYDSNGQKYDTSGMAGKGGPANPTTARARDLLRKMRRAEQGIEAQQNVPVPEENLRTTAAFVWTHRGELLAGVHKATPDRLRGEEVYTDFLHHTSLDAGSLVLCAGMIRVIEGKVELISNNSGHYQPPVASLQEFVRWLHGKQCLTSNAIVHTTQPYAYKSVDEFLELAVPAAPQPAQLLRDRKDCLTKLKQALDGVDILYDLSGGKALFFIRVRSDSSKIASKYFGGDFKRDIDTALQHPYNEVAWRIPIRVVRALAGLPGGEHLAAITQDVQKLKQETPPIQFSDAIFKLQPLTRGSTLSQLLNKKLTAWSLSYPP